MDTIEARPADVPVGAPGSSGARRRLLGSFLIREGLITSAQLDEALQVQASLAEPRPIGGLLVDHGRVTQEELNYVLEKYHKKYRLGDLLVETNAITEAQLEQALEHQRKTELRLGDALLQLNFLTERQMRQALCQQLQIDFVDLDVVGLDRALGGLVPRDYAARHRVLPVARAGNRLTVAMDDPTNTDIVQQLETVAGCRIDVVTSTRAAFQRALVRLYGEGPTAGEPPPASAAAPAPDPAHGELAALRTAYEALRRDRQTAAEALRELSERHAETTMRLNKLASEYAALRDAYQATSHALREQRQRYEALLRTNEQPGDDLDLVLRQLSPNPPPRRRPRG
jgi:Type II secretion system (T2SS), protein E, N-terminal domain